MKKGTVICVGNFELPDKNAASHRVVNNAKLFALSGYNTVFLGARREGEYFSGIRELHNDTPFRMFEQSYPATTKQWFIQMFDIANIKKLISLFPDTAAVLLYNTQFSTLKAVKKSLKKTEIKLLYDCTEWNSFTEGNFIKRKIKSFDSGLVENRLSGVPDGIIAVSSLMEKKYAGCPLIKLPPLVDTDEKIWHRENEENNIKNGRFVFYYAGSPSNKERLDVALEAFSALPAEKCEMRIAGITKEQFCSFYPEKKRYGDSENVSFLGRVSHEEAVKGILSSDCCVFIRENSRRNSAGFPTKFAEAFTCGVPVITTDVSDISEYADDTCVLLKDALPETAEKAMRGIMNAGSEKSGLRTTFDYRSFDGEFRRWLERI